MALPLLWSERRDLELCAASYYRFLSVARRCALQFACANWVFKSACFGEINEGCNAPLIYLVGAARFRTPVSQLVDRGSGIAAKLWENLLRQILGVLNQFVADH